MTNVSWLVGWLVYSVSQLKKHRRKLAVAMIRSPNPVSDQIISSAKFDLNKINFGNISSDTHVYMPVMDSVLVIPIFFHIKL